MLSVKAKNPNEFHGRAGKRSHIQAFAAVCLAILILQAGVRTSFAQSATVTADFGDRAGGTTIHPGMFGFNPVSLLSAKDLGMVAQAGFSEARRTPDLPAIYASRTPDWSSLDWTVQQAKAAGLHPLVVISRTPPWLQPSSNPCGANSDASHAPPTDVGQWAQIAASFVAHLDEKFPGLVQDFEIWNEPDMQTSLCSDPNTDLSRLQLYLRIYAAAASAMHAQAAQDGAAIRIGGPAVSNPAQALPWVTSLLTDSQTAGEVDFVSYHFYPTGAQFAQSDHKWGDLLSRLQGAQGALDTYLSVAKAVHGGSQPDALKTPIYITEFNDGSAFQADCCRNNAAYGPLWNSVFLADLLNLAFAGQQLPQRAYYYAGSAPPYFCLLGQLNPAMDCNKSGSSPYPQYYAYQLFASPSYLGLKNGGHMASSVSVAGAPNLLATAFYTGSKDVTVIINPTATAYSSVSLAAKNTGFGSVAATSFLLDSSHPHIAKQAISSLGETATVAVPAYSTLAVLWSGGQRQDSPPVASLTVSPASGKAPLHITADSSESYDPDGSIASRRVDFGDGSPVASSAVVSHTYNKAGQYTVRVTTTDNDGLSSAQTANVTVSAPPSADFSMKAAVTGSQGATLRFTLTITPKGTLSSAVSLSCAQVPQGKECFFTPKSLSVGSKPAHAVLSVAPAANTAVARLIPSRLLPLGWFLSPAAMLLMGTFRHRSNRRRIRKLLLASLALCLLGLQLACGNSGSQADSTASHVGVVVVRATSGGQSHTLTVSLKQ